ncbi:Molybdopterin synthase catalytic subunit [Plasmodiophora brassicae]
MMSGGAAVTAPPGAADKSPALASTRCSCGNRCDPVDECPRLSSVWLRPHALHGDVVERAVRLEAIGAIATFVGVARADVERDGRRVVGLTYDAYERMAVKQFHETCDAIRARWPSVHRIGIEHRVGFVPVGEASVRMAVSAPHRRDALRAVEFAIDHMKTTAPIFKQEHYNEGAPAWKPNAS